MLKLRQCHMFIAIGSVIPGGCGLLRPEPLPTSIQCMWDDDDFFPSESNSPLQQEHEQLLRRKERDSIERPKNYSQEIE